MTRLTLHWHLRTIANGCPSEVTTEQFADLASHETPSYNTLLATEALRSDDAVAFLDAVTKDPARSIEQRQDAAILLGEHILERRLLRLTSYPSTFRSIDGEIRQAFVDSELPTSNQSPGHWEMIRCPNCREGEVLYDWERDEARCHCGTGLTIPMYP